VASCDPICTGCSGAITKGALQLLEPSGGGGGILRTATGSAQLSSTQLELVVVLVRRMSDDAEVASCARGFVRTSELRRVLSWDVRGATETHVRQLVWRTRRTLCRSGVGDLIESRLHLGYRLCLLPPATGRP
jgi:hypothetical protein